MRLRFRSSGELPPIPVGWMIALCVAILVKVVILVALLLGVWDDEPDAEVKGVSIERTTTTWTDQTPVSSPPSPATPATTPAVTSSSAAVPATRSLSPSTVSSVKATPRPTTTVTAAPRSFLEIAQREVGKAGPYTEGGFWCAKFVSWVAEQAKVPGWVSNDSPARLEGIAREQGWHTGMEPQVGGLVFIDLTGCCGPPDYEQVTHVAIVEWVNGQEIGTIEGNADDSGVVVRKVRRVDDGYVLGFARMGA